MRTPVPEKLLSLVEDIDAKGNVSLARLTVLKKWFQRPERLVALSLWAARRAASRKGKTSGEAGELFDEARALLAVTAPIPSGLDRAAAEDLYHRLRLFQNEFRKQAWRRVRIVPHWNLMVVEQALEVYLWHRHSPSHGYRVAADYCRHYDPRYGNGLNGPSRAKLLEMVRFMLAVEALEDREP